MWVRLTYLVLYDKLFILEWSKVVFQCLAGKLGSIPCSFPLWSGEHSPDWVEGIRWWQFLEEIVCLETILGYLEIKLDLKSEHTAMLAGNMSWPNTLFILNMGN